MIALLGIILALPCPTTTPCLQSLCREVVAIPIIIGTNTQDGAVVAGTIIIGKKKDLDGQAGAMDGIILVGVIVRAAKDLSPNCLLV